MINGCSVMRKMLSAKAGATFSMDCPEFTYAVRKDVVEIIYKVKPGVYLVVNFARVDATRGMLFVNWGRFWDRMTNERLQLPKVEKCCPVLMRCASCVSAAPQSEYTLSDCCSSSAPGGSAQGPPSRLPAAGRGIEYRDILCNFYKGI